MFPRKLIPLVVPMGFVSLHDAAARGVRLPDPAGTPDAAPAGIGLAAVAATTAGNYTTCHEIAERLIALQRWIAEQRAAAAEP